MLIECSECKKEVSDKAHACPHCGNPMKPTQTTVQFDTAPHKRRKYKVRLLLFIPMFVIGSIFGMFSLLFGGGWITGLWFLIGLIGFIGSMSSSIGHWLAEP